MSEHSKKDLDGIAIAIAIASIKSKDPKTKVACMILGPDGEPRSWGYNGMVRGADDSALSRMVAPEKYFWFEHAERNAIYNAARVGVPLNGCTAYCTKFPCMDCARGLVQVGIVRIVSTAPKDTSEQIWKDQYDRTLLLLRESDVELVLV